MDNEQEFESMIEALLEKLAPHLDSILEHMEQHQPSIETVIPFILDRMDIKSTFSAVLSEEDDLWYGIGRKKDGSKDWYTAIGNRHTGSLLPGAWHIRPFDFKEDI